MRRGSRRDVKQALLSHPGPPTRARWEPSRPQAGGGASGFGCDRPRRDLQSSATSDLVWRSFIDEGVEQAKLSCEVAMLD
jgi:hypothetical protein